MENLDVKLILSKRLRELTEEKRDLDYKMSDKKQAELMGMSYNTFRNYLDGKSDCSASNLKLMSQFYHVTTDYLLGITSIQTTKPEIQMICEYTGLSENAVEKLHEIYTAEYGHRYVERVNKSVEIEGIENCPEFNDHAMNFINHLITDDDFANIIKRAVKLKEDIAEMKEIIPDDESNEQAQMLLTRQNRKILLRAKIFVVTDDGYIDLMIEKMKSIFGTILDHIIDK